MCGCNVTRLHTKHRMGLPVGIHIVMCLCLSCWTSVRSKIHDYFFPQIVVKELGAGVRKDTHTNTHTHSCQVKHAKSHTCSISSQSSRPTKIISRGRRWRVPELLTRNHDVTLMVGPLVKTFLASWEKTGKQTE